MQRRRAGRTSPCSRLAPCARRSPRRRARRGRPRRRPRFAASRRRRGRGRSRAASRRMSSTGSGASQRRSRTRGSMPRSRNRRATRSDMCRPFAQVTIVRSSPSRYVRGSAHRDVLVGQACDPAVVALFVQVAGVVQRDRLEEDADAPVDLRRLRAGGEHRRGVVRPRRRGDHEPRDVAQHADGVVVVEVPAEPALVPVAGDPHDHPVPVPPLREELQRRRLAAQLILGVVEVREVLDLRDRQEPAHATRRGQGRGSTSRRGACRRRAPPRTARAAHASRRRPLPSPRRPRRRAGRSGWRSSSGSESGVDRLRERHGRRVVEARRARLLRDRPGTPRRERRHDLLRGLHLRQLLPPRARLRAAALAPRGSRSRAPLPCGAGRGHEPARGAEDRVSFVVGADRLRRPIRHLGVRARVAQVAHRPQVEHRGLPLAREPSRPARVTLRAPRRDRARPRSRSGSSVASAASPRPSRPASGR